MISFFLRIFPRPYLELLARFLLPLISFFYKGTRYEDPIDGYRYRKLLDYGHKVKRKNALAPHSMSLERHRLLWVYLTLRRPTFFTAYLEVLHMAPELCLQCKFEKMDNLNYITCDLNSRSAKVKADAHCLPFANNSFDVVIANHLLEHVQNDFKVLSEFHRVLKPYGFAIFQVPLDEQLSATIEEGADALTAKERARLFGQKDHVRLYGFDIIDRMASSGFNVEQVNLTRDLEGEMIKKYCLMKDEIFFVCYKNHFDYF